MIRERIFKVIKNSLKAKEIQSASGRGKTQPEGGCQEN